MAASTDKAIFQLFCFHKYMEEFGSFKGLFVPSLDISVSYSCKWNYFLASWTTYNEVCPAYSNFLASKNLYDIRSIGDRYNLGDLEREE
jgi:hypothetical protein